jgi:hypothetical protein
MKNIFKKSLFVFSTALLLTACGQNEKPKEMYCGLGMSAFEVMDAKSMAANFKYTEKDKVLLTMVTDEVKSVAGDKPTEVYFFNSDDTFLGIYVVAPDDKALVEKISCALLQSSSAGLPETRKIVFYTNQSNNLVAAVKTKPKA